MDYDDVVSSKAARSIRERNHQVFTETLFRVASLSDFADTRVLPPQWRYLPSLLAFVTAALDLKGGPGLTSHIEILATQAAVESTKSGLSLDWQLRALRILQEQSWKAILDTTEEDAKISASEFLAVQKRFDVFSDAFVATVFGETYRKQTDQLITSVSQLEAVKAEKFEIEERLREATIASVEALASAIDAKDHYTSHHSQRTAEISVALASLISLPDNQITEIRHGALLHDIGKIGIHDSVLTKQGALTGAERDLIKLHPIIGASILAPVGVLQTVILCVLQHHERFDGTGYPTGLSREEIALEARILSVADAFDAMTSSRAYRPALEIEKVIQELKDKAGKQFDPDIVDILLDNLDKVPVAAEDAA